MRNFFIAALFLAAACRSTTPNDDWPAYANAGGTRYSPLTDIDRTTVSRLQVAWTYHTGETTFVKESEKKSTFEATPIVVDGTLYVSTGFNKVIALDAATGREKWTYDPHVDRDSDYSEVTSRGVSYWGEGKRIFEGTIDARLIAIDAETGAPAKEFGVRGTVDGRRGLALPGRASRSLGLRHRHATGAGRSPRHQSHRRRYEDGASFLFRSHDWCARFSDRRAARAGQRCSRGGGVAGAALPNRAAADRAVTLETRGCVRCGR